MVRIGILSVLSLAAGGCVVASRPRGDAPLAVEDVVRMTQSGVRDEAILAVVRDLGVFPPPTAADVWRMRESGVSPRVIDACFEALPERRRLLLWVPLPWHGWWWWDRWHPHP